MTDYPDTPNVRDYGPTDEPLVMYDGFKYDDLTRLARARWKRIRELEQQLGNAFVEGAKWWESRINGASMWQQDQNAASEEAERRGYDFRPSREKALEERLSIVLASHPAPEPISSRPDASESGSETTSPTEGHGRDEGAWIQKRAMQEDGCDVSVGGLADDLGFDCSAPAPEPVALRAENDVPTLDELVEWARRQPPPTEAQKREHAISFAYGNLKLSGWQGTREDIEKAADERSRVDR